MIKAICYALCAFAILCASSSKLFAETTDGPATVEQGITESHLGRLSKTEAFRPDFSDSFSPAVRLAMQCKANGKSCKRNDQCCSGNCQKATDAPKGTCLHGD